MKLKLLLIDDSEDDAFFFKRTLSQTGIDADTTSKNDGEEGLLQIAQETFDCIFLDYNLPVMDGLQVLLRIRKSGIDTPVIMLTGQKDDQVIVKLMLEGASDYLPKHALSAESLRLSLENSQKVYKIKKEKEMAEQALKVSEARLAEAQRIALLGNWEYDYNTQKFFLSEEAQRILEQDQYHTENIQELINRVSTEDQNQIWQSISKFSETPSGDLNIRFTTNDGSLRHYNVKYRVCMGQNEGIETVLGTIQDITILKNALLATRKATIKSKATTIVMTIAVFLFLISEAILDPIIDSITASLLISLSCKGSIAMALKPMEYFLERVMMGKYMYG